MSNSSNWWLGDWVRWGKHHYGDETFEIASKITGYDQQTLRNFAWVATRYDYSRRRENVTWSHHAELARLDGDDQDRLLDEVAKRNLSVRQLRTRVRRQHQVAVAAAVSNLDAGVQEGAELNDLELLICPHCGEAIDLSPDAMAYLLAGRSATAVPPRDPGGDRPEAIRRE